jgi:hypothetical protein
MMHSGSGSVADPESVAPDPNHAVQDRGRASPAGTPYWERLKTFCFSD